MSAGSDAVVVLATYNEAETIGPILEQLADYAVIVVDDSSPDGTGELARQHAHVEVISRPGKQGIASAYLCGLSAALERQPVGRGRHRIRFRGRDQQQQRQFASPYPRHRPGRYALCGVERRQQRKL